MDLKENLVVIFENSFRFEWRTHEISSIILLHYNKQSHVFQTLRNKTNNGKF